MTMEMKKMRFQLLHIYLSVFECYDVNFRRKMISIHSMETEKLMMSGKNILVLTGAKTTRMIS